MSIIYPAGGWIAFLAGALLGYVVFRQYRSREKTPPKEAGHGHEHTKNNHHEHESHSSKDAHGSHGKSQDDHGGHGHGLSNGAVTGILLACFALALFLEAGGIGHIIGTHGALQLPGGQVWRSAAQPPTQSANYVKTADYDVNTTHYCAEMPSRTEVYPATAEWRYIEKEPGKMFCMYPNPDEPDTGIKAEASMTRDGTYGDFHQASFWVRIVSPTPVQVWYEEYRVAK